jgi:tRNA (mo5U34)-methyltransferase
VAPQGSDRPRTDDERLLRGGSEPGDHTCYDPAPATKRLLQSIYPGGLERRSVLDCACNNGAFLFAARELGAGRCVGFDVREHWINQARFLVRHRGEPAHDLHFKNLDLYELPALDLDPFDITFFAGIFYHLPDPISGLQIAADLTREVIFVSSAARSGLPDGMLVTHEESQENPLSGVHGLNWFPTGPGVIARVLAQMGFAETRCYAWRPSGANPELDLVQVIAGRKKGSLVHFDSDDRGLTKVVQRNVQPRATVLVTTLGKDRLREIIRSIPFRQVWHFPRDSRGRYDSSLDGRSDALAAHLEELRTAGASYLLVPQFAFAWLEQNAELRSLLDGRYRLIGDEPETCLLYDLRG